MKNYDDIKKVLNRPFHSKLIKQRSINGKYLSYVEGSEYIRRLNEAFDSAWDFDIIEHFIDGDFIVVRALLTVHILDKKIRKNAFGGTQIIRRRKDGKVLQLSDDYKIAATDALKKACSMLGIGLHLYSDGETIPEENDIPAVPDQLFDEPEVPMANEEQINKIIMLAKFIGWDRNGLVDFCQNKFGKPHHKLDYDQITNAIDMLIDFAREKGYEG